MNLLDRIFPHNLIKNFGKVAKIFLTILMVISAVSTVTMAMNFVSLIMGGYAAHIVTWLFLICVLLYIGFFVFLYKSIYNRDKKSLLICQVCIISAFVLLQGIFVGLIAGLLWTIPLYYLKKSFV